MLDEREKLILQQRAIDALKERIATESYLGVQAVAKRLGVGRAIIEQLPEELLPYTDLGTGIRMRRRYHPADVLAADARIRAWRRAQQEGKGDEYLRRARAELEELDRGAICAATEARRVMGTQG